MRLKLGNKLLVHAALVGLSILFLFPFLWILSTAVKPLDETMKIPPVWIPSRYEFNNFWDAMSYGKENVGYVPFLVYARNTLLICILVVSGVVVSNSLV